ncbi:JmjC domain [Macleaya cordata]|uniref:JmjC domain n=1 Tax=Macleaya cordata TaxID=56857 RepID=A0A200R5S9_MACCD|nr:JmjC domain [Macleaya cordata]
MGGVEIPSWLKELPLAPEFRPTDTEFADPIAYISKIEKEASAFGICKVIPPLPKPTKKYIFSNLNKSLSKSPELGNDGNLPSVCSSSQFGSGDKGNNGEVKAVFTTRHQELGYSSKRSKGSIRQSAVHKQVWQSGEAYTLEQFESKSKVFARSHLAMIKEVTPLVVEALFWKAASEKPIYVEYANDVPGSGFGEPEFSNWYFQKRRRKRKYDRNHRRNLNCEKREIDTERNSNIVNDEDVSMKNDSDPSSETCKLSPSSASLLPDESPSFSKNRSSNAGPEREGTAGWKLSNSPWNLQVIARSPGSLTRFMLEDIPGVTSPMIYIGMLFSWFAWHVEDHELHSLNYLHTGSPKTWYAVPGDCGFAFEEAIRTQGYGGNIDRLAALTLLGEKTNLLSPEVVVASRIPCCRLVQNPGEFVVTFPRAYHVGFSHGFNCGEAANFGTPQWLKVAKEAAVRRAAMDLLPMLSHQQLLYMLTMSFISRVPRALLPGARSSRLRDRQKEERELLVKKAFIDDMLNENNLLLAFLRKESTSRAVTWDPESLPFPSKDSQSLPSSSTVDVSCLLVDERNPDTHNPEKEKNSADRVHMETSNDSTMPLGNVSFLDPKNADNCENQVGPTRLSMGTVEDLYKDDNDLPCGLHVDSGTLACVACGILGFPFMSIVQPSQRASEELFPADCQMAHEGQELLGLLNPLSPSEVDHTVKNSASDLQGAQEGNQKEKILSKYNGHIPMTEADRRDVKLVNKNLEKSFSDATCSFLETTDITETKDTTLLNHPITVAPNDEMNHPMNCTADAGIPVVNISQDPKGLPIHPKGQVGKEWSRSNGFLRPRVFCLEHGLEIEELLHSQGGANVLIICHSAYPKIKAHAFAVAEEIGVPFYCEEVPLECASQEDLDLINISIDDEEHEEGGEDWTSRMGINLQYHVKLKKLFPSKQDRHALALGGLFSGMTPDSDVSSLKWNSRKTRTPHKATGPSQSKLCEKTQIKEDKPVEISDRSKAIRENTLIKYSRRACNDKMRFSSEASGKSCGHPGKHPPKEAFSANETVDNNRILSEATLCSTENSRNDAMELAKFPTMENSELKRGDCTTEETRETSVISDSSKSAGLLVFENMRNDSIELTEFSSVQNSAEDTTRCTSVVPDPAKSPDTQAMAISTSGSFETQTENGNLEETNMDEKGGEYAIMDNTEMQQEDQTATNEPKVYNQAMIMDTSEMQQEDQTATNEAKVYNQAIIMDASEMQQEDQTATNEPKVYNQAMIMDTSEMQQGDQTATNEPVVYNQANSMIMDNSEMQQADQTATNEPVVYNQANSMIMNNSEMQQEDKTATNDPVACNQANSIGPPKLPMSVEESSVVLQDIQATEEAGVGNAEEAMKLESYPTVVDPEPTMREQNKRRREFEQITEDEISNNGFIRGPCEGLRPRTSRTAASGIGTDNGITGEVLLKKVRQRSDGAVICKGKKENEKEAFACNLEGCRMSFKTRAELLMHKRNRCTHKGCGKRFSSHKYAMLHQRVHVEERPLKCPWEGCKMSFKWAWARTEHLRVHTGERPYQCQVEGCGLTFRFVSDYSRHRRKTGHYVNSPT